MTSSTHAFTGWVSRLAREHTKPLAGVARAEGLTPADSLDAVQEAFHTLLGLPQARSLAEHDEDARGLLVVLTRNAARNMRKRHHRARPHEGTEVADAIADEGPSIQTLLERAEEHVALLGCVTRLGEVQRHVVTLRMLEELSNEEVARTLGIAPGHVAVLLHRAKKNLFECMVQ